MKHTKAPWYVKFMHEDDPDSDFWVKSDENPKVSYGTDIMADDYGEHNGYPREQRLADAKLIAAAPEMLEAMQEFVDRCDKREVRSVRTYAKFKEIIKKAIE